MATQTYVNSTTLTDAAEFNKFDTAGYPQLTGVAGTNTITATGPANITLATSPPLWFIPAATNTGATTLNITPSGGAALGAKNVFFKGAACVSGEIVISVPVAVVYDGTQYNIIGGSSITGTTASTFTFNGGGGSTGSLTLTWQKIGNFVTINIPAALATSGTGSTSLASNTAVPAAIRPTSEQQQQATHIFDPTGPGVGGFWTISTGGIFTLTRDSVPTAWTNSTASCGTVKNQSITYFIG